MTTGTIITLCANMHTTTRMPTITTTTTAT